MPRVFTWRRLDVEGTGLVRLDSGDEGFVVDGFEVTTDGAVRFQVLLDRDWCTREARLDAIGPEGPVSRELVADGSGSWRIDGEPRADLDGCVDVDIAATPFTNTFVIRRLDLAPGDEAEVRAVWIGVPALDIEVVEQSYRRLEPDGDDGDRYEYRPVGSERGRVITVDDEGIAIDYEGFAERIGP